MDGSSSRPDRLITLLDLRAHPEGGHYGELHRSSTLVHPLDGRGPRPAITTIYYLLRSGEVSRWHRVQSDEVWHFYEGAPLQLWIADLGGGIPYYVRAGTGGRRHPAGPDRARRMLASSATDRRVHPRRLQRGAGIRLRRLHPGAGVSARREAASGALGGSCRVAVITPER